MMDGDQGWGNFFEDGEKKNKPGASKQGCVGGSGIKGLGVNFDK